MPTVGVGGAAFGWGACNHGQCGVGDGAPPVDGLLLPRQILIPLSRSLGRGSLGQPDGLRILGAVCGDVHTLLQ